MGVSDQTVAMEETIKHRDSGVEYQEDSCSSSVSSDPEPGDNTTKQYRLASSFELGDEQPNGDSVQWKRKEDDSFHNLFGPPSFVETQKPVENTEDTHKIEKSMVKKPLPVNPVAGDVFGMEPKKRNSGENAAKSTDQAKVRKAATWWTSQSSLVMKDRLDLLDHGPQMQDFHFTWQIYL